MLVTGAGGFIGSHLVERLVELGAHVRAFVHYNAQGGRASLNELPIEKNIEITAGDVCDKDMVFKTVRDMDIVFHLAALISIPYSYEAPNSYLRANLEGTLNLLRAASESDIECFVHTSTSEVYGTANYAPIDESHPLQAQSPYAASKIGADKMAEAFYHSFDLPVTTIRPFNTFGPRQSTRAIIPTIITQILTQKVLFLGSLYPTRDLNYVSNTVEGFLLAVTPEACGKTINLGSGREISIGALVQLIADMLGKKIEIKFDSQRARPEKSEVGRLIADNTLARTLLNWEPCVGLEEGLERTISWVRNNMFRYRPNRYAV